MVWRSTVSACAWIVWSIVSVTLFPSRTGVEEITWTARPSGVFSTVWVPGLPES
jgi:hypothetical protein